MSRPPAVVRLLGIRHHGPGSARSVLAALDALDPEVVCIEGPPEAEPVLELAADPDMVPPIALLAYDPDRPTRASFWPLAAFSPEWQALRWAQQHGRPVRFIDLPAAHSLAGQAEEDSPSVRDPLAQLAAAAGYGDVERWWDDLVEHGTSDVFEAVEEAMAAVRETSPPPGRGSGSERRRCAERWPQWSRTGSVGSPSSAGPGTSPRSARRRAPPTRPRCGGWPRARWP